MEVCLFWLHARTETLCIVPDTARTLLPGGAYASRTRTAINALDARRAFSRSGNLSFFYPSVTVLRTYRLERELRRVRSDS